MYSGVGTNLSFVSENDLKYISVGCVGFSSLYGSNCGFGAGWIKTDLFGVNSYKHGFGVYLSLVDNESYAGYRTTSEGQELYRHERDVYGAGVNGGFFQVGYQF